MPSGSAGCRKWPISSATATRRRDVADAGTDGRPRRRDDRHRPQPTLGERLDAAARAHRGAPPGAARVGEPAWPPCSRRAARLGESPGDRFERREAAGETRSSAAVPAGPQLPASGPADPAHGRCAGSGRGTGAGRATGSGRRDPGRGAASRTRAQLSDIAGPGAGAAARTAPDAAADALAGRTGLTP